MCLQGSLVCKDTYESQMFQTIAPASILRKGVNQTFMLLVWILTSRGHSMCQLITAQRGRRRIVLADWPIPMTHCCHRHVT